MTQDQLDMDDFDHNNNLFERLLETELEREQNHLLALRMQSNSSLPATPFNTIVQSESDNRNELWNNLSAFDPQAAHPVPREICVFARKQILRLCFIRQTPATIGIELVQFDRAAKSKARLSSEPSAGAMSLEELNLNVLQNSHLQMTFPSAGTYIFSVTAASHAEWNMVQGLVHSDPEQPLVSLKVVAVHNSARKNAHEHVEIFNLK